MKVSKVWVDHLNSGLDDSFGCGYINRVPSHQLTWKCTKPLSSWKVVFLHGSVRKPKLVGARVTAKKWMAADRCQRPSGFDDSFDAPTGSLLTGSGAAAPPGGPRQSRAGCAGEGGLFLGSPWDGQGRSIKKSNVLGVGDQHEILET